MATRRKLSFNVDNGRECITAVTCALVLSRASVKYRPIKPLVPSTRTRRFCSDRSKLSEIITALGVVGF